MSMHAKLPAHAQIVGEDVVRAAFDDRLKERGRKHLAYDSGVSLSQTYRIEHGCPVSVSVAEELGFRLAWVREEELALANKIAREIARPSKLKEGE